MSGDESHVQRGGGGARAAAATPARPLRLSALTDRRLSFYFFVPRLRYFVLEFKLVDSKELSPLQELIDSMMGGDKQKLMGASGSSAAASSPAAASAPAASPTAAEDDACVVKND